MGKKKVLVAVDPALWGEVKAAAAREGRNVGLVVENALRLYLLGPERLEAVAPLQDPGTHPRPSLPTVQELRTLVASVGDPSVLPGTTRERAQRIAERQAYYREHPEEEGQ